jgi:hypothetical protein
MIGKLYKPGLIVIAGEGYMQYNRSDNETIKAKNPGFSFQGPVKFL